MGGEINVKFGQWLWLSWMRGRFRDQRSAVQILQSSPKLYTEHVLQLVVEKSKIKRRKEAVNGPFEKEPNDDVTDGRS